MSGPFGSSQWMYSSGAASFYDTEIDGSLRFNDGDSAYLTQTPSVEGNRDTWTWSCWFKIGETDTSSGLPFFGGYANDNDRDVFRIRNDKLEYQLAHSGSFSDVITNAVFRDHSAWYHVVLTVDLTQGTQSNRGKIWVNGVLQSLSSNSLPNSSSNTKFTDDRLRYVGARFQGGSVGPYFDGYMAEVHFCDGTAYDADDFGELKSGVWVPKSPSVSYGTTGFHLEFAGNANDSSGNGNNWTANNISSHDYVPDSPTNNFATLNPISQNGTTTAVFSQGNLDVTRSSGDYFQAMATIPVTSGKWYCEFRCVSQTALRCNIGFLINDKSSNTTSNRAILQDGYAYRALDGNSYIEGSSSSYGATYADGDIISVALDSDSGSCTFYKNGVSQGQAFSSISADNYLIGTAGEDGWRIVANFGQDSTFAGGTSAGGNSDGNGYGDFKYSVPSGYLALCTANLPEPTISPADDASPEDYFGVDTYSGTSAAHERSNFTFQPDFLWLKCRNVGESHFLFNSLSGVTKYLRTDSDGADSTNSSYLTSFDADGFTLGTNENINQTGETYVAWAWKAGTSVSGSTSGLGTSKSYTGSVSTESGFSIIAYEGNGTSGHTIPHHLDTTPDVVLVKNRTSTNNWSFNADGIAGLILGTNFLEFNLGNPKASNVNQIQSFSSTLVTLGQGGLINTDTNDYIAWCFHSVEGYSRFGDYTGNGSSDGPFVYTGFRPSFVIAKRTDSGDSGVMSDSKRGAYNAIDEFFKVNSFNAESNLNITGGVDYLSNGFKWRHGDGSVNASGGTYVYMAFAENPFKYANAR